MRKIVLEIKAEAEAELIMAKAKIAVAESILERIDNAEKLEKACAMPVEAMVTEAPTEGCDEVATEHFTDDVM